MYAELSCHTHYSFLRGASHPSELVTRAAELGLKALAITDRDGVYAIPKAYGAIKEYPGLKLICGAELKVESQYLTLLAKNRAGYGIMCRLLTASHAGKSKGKAFLGWAEFNQFIEKYRSDRDGLIMLTNFDFQYLTELREALDQDQLYLKLSRFLDGHDEKRTQNVLSASRRYSLPIVATNDIYFHVPERRMLQDTLTSIREGMPLSDAGFQLFSNGERYLKSPMQMVELFKDLPEAISNTVKVAESCHFSPSELRYRYPSEWIPEGETAQGYLERLTYEGAQKRYPSGIPDKTLKQLKHEFKLIDEMKFSDYFLTIWEIVEFARSRHILCQGRGSAANSIVCYCLGITAIDPVRMDLLFERFISVERGEPPDIDVDFENGRREEVIQHIYEKYGRDRAGMVSAIITYQGRSAYREVAKALHVPLEEAKSGEDPRVEALVNEIQGFPRHLSIHSGGFTLSADPMIETVPIEPARMEGRTIVQWDKEDLATIGLLKVDILALGMLTALHKTMDLLRPKRDFDLYTIPADDQATYKMIQAGDTVGTFQIESRAQINMVRRLLPKTFYDLVIEVAIVRPGPIVGQMVHPYLRRRRGLESSKSPDPRLEPILSRTLGVPLFQEQVMKMAMSLAGFTPGEADRLRRAMGSWRTRGQVETMGKKLMEGLLANGLPQEFVDRVFLQVQGFAEYGFPESHAASFALIAYASAYLKCHYPAEFTCGLINSQPMGFYSSHTLVEDAKRHGVQVLPVDPHHSDWDCTIEPGSDAALRVGFRVVRGLSEGDGAKIISERKKRKFESLSDFFFRTKLRPSVMNDLALGGAFDCFGIAPRDALWKIIEYRSLSHPEAQTARAERAQLSLFDRFGAAEGDTHFDELSEYETIQSDYRSYGLSTRGHPLTALRKQWGKALPSMTTSDVRQSKPDRVVRVAGLLIVRQRPPTAKGTVFGTLEDESGFLDLILHKSVYEKYREVFLADPFQIVTGKVQRDLGGGPEAMSLLVSRVESLFENSELCFQTRDFR